MKYVHLENNKILGYYSKDIHPNIPEGCLEITDEQWQEAININANCYEDGKFIVKDFRTPEEIQEQEQAQFRAERNQLLIEADIEINKLDDLGKDSSAWRAYRQALRDSTESWVLPTKPEGVN